MVGLPYITEEGLRKHLNDNAIVDKHIGKGPFLCTRTYQGILNDDDTGFYLNLGKRTCGIKSGDLIRVLVHYLPAIGSGRCLRIYRIELKEG